MINSDQTKADKTPHPTAIDVQFEFEVPTADATTQTFV